MARSLIGVDILLLCIRGVAIFFCIVGASLRKTILVSMFHFFVKKLNLYLAQVITHDTSTRGVIIHRHSPSQYTKKKEKIKS